MAGWFTHEVWGIFGQSLFEGNCKGYFKDILYKVYVDVVVLKMVVVG
jgi:hypothetical protein